MPPVLIISNFLFFLSRFLFFKIICTAFLAAHSTIKSDFFISSSRFINFGLFFFNFLIKDSALFLSISFSPINSKLLLLWSIKAAISAPINPHPRIPIFILPQVKYQATLLNLSSSPWIQHQCRNLHIQLNSAGLYFLKPQIIYFHTNFVSLALLLLELYRLGAVYPAV